MRIATLALALFTASCGLVQEKRPEATSASLHAAPAVTQGEGRLEALPAQDLAAGECGLFLFSRAPRPLFIFFADTKGGALVKLDGRELRLSQISESLKPTEERILRFAESKRALEIVVALKVAEAGSESDISSGSLRLVQADGWETVMPIGGAIACEGD